MAHPSPESAQAPAPAPRDGVRYEWRTVEVDERMRRYLLAEPSGQRAATLSPVIIDVHGSGLDVAGHLSMTRSDRVCARDGVVLVPEAAISFRLRPGLPVGRAWNVPGAPLVGEQAPRSDAPNDVEFVAAMLDDISAIRRVDPARVHAMGFSGGARLCCSLARELPGRLASIGAVAGLRFPPKLDSTSVAVVAVHGRDDGINPYLGEAGPRWDDPVERAAQAWAVAAGAQNSTQHCVRPGVDECRWSAGGLDRVRLVTLAGAAHCWPGSADEKHRRDFGVCDEIDATETLLDFFAAHPFTGPGPDCDQRSC